MKLYVVISDDYDEEWGAEIYLHGIFDNYEKAKKYVIEHYINGYTPKFHKTLDNFVNNYIKEIELNKNCNVYLGGCIE